MKTNTNLGEALEGNKARHEKFTYKKLLCLLFFNIIFIKQLIILYKVLYQKL